MFHKSKTLALVLPEDLQVPFLASPRQSCQVFLLQILRVIYLGAVHFWIFFVVDG